MSEHNFRRKLQDYEADFSPKDWNAMQERLQDAGLQRRPVALWWPKFAAAAAVLLIGAFLLWPSDEQPQAAHEDMPVLQEDAPLPAKESHLPEPQFENEAIAISEKRMPKNSAQPKSFAKAERQSAVEEMPIGVVEEMAASEEVFASRAISIEMPLVATNIMAESPLQSHSQSRQTMGIAPLPGHREEYAKAFDKALWRLCAGTGAPIMPLLDSEDDMIGIPITADAQYAISRRWSVGLEAASWAYKNSYSVSSASRYVFRKDLRALHLSARADYHWAVTKRLDAYLGAKVGYTTYQDRKQGKLVAFAADEAAADSVSLGNLPGSRDEILALQYPHGKGQWTATPHAGVAYRAWKSAGLFAEVAARPTLVRMGVTMWIY